MKQFTPVGTVIFALVVSLVCSIFVSFSAVGLKDLQKENERLDRQKKVLDVAGLFDTEVAQDSAKMSARYEALIKPELISLKGDEGCKGFDPKNFDQMKTAKDPKTSFDAPKGNKAKVRSIPNCAQVFRVLKEAGSSESVALILPVEGKGLWSTLYGYIALEKNLNDVKGLTFYKHAETPGLGGEVDNPKWKAQWKGKKAFKINDKKLHVPALKVEKGTARDDYSVDGLSGATLTSNGVTHLLQFWLGANGFGPYLERERAKAQGGN
jgi:Na+-transporting NADH:ubiquinone oxidoreductase subunit C